MILFVYECNKNEFVNLTIFNTLPPLVFLDSFTFDRFSPKKKKQNAFTQLAFIDLFLNAFIVHRLMLIVLVTVASIERKINKILFKINQQMPQQKIKCG